MMYNETWDEMIKRISSKPIKKPNTKISKPAQHSENYDYYTQILMPSVVEKERRLRAQAWVHATLHPESVLTVPADRGHFGGPNNP